MARYRRFRQPYRGPKRIVRKGYRPRFVKYRRKPSTRTGFLAVRATEIKEITLADNVQEHIHQEAFRIADIPSILSYTPLFDQYRIRKVTVKLYPTTRTDPTQNNRMTFCSSIDLDGGQIGQFSQLTECSNARLSIWAPDVGTAQKSITLVPRYKNYIVKDASDPLNLTFATTVGKRGSWIDLADRGQTQHFGLNLGWMSTTGGELNFTQDVRFVTTYHIEFRKIR